MKIHYFTPYSIEKKLGKAYNETCSQIANEEDWICLLDGDTMFLNSNWGEIIYNAIMNYSNQYSLFTCYASRTGGESQMFNGIISEDPNILNHRDIAIKNEIINKGKVKNISDTRYISGHLVLFPKWLWTKVKFVEKTTQGSILGIDNTFFIHARLAGYKVGLIQDLYLLHYYRLKEGKEFKSHLF